MKAAAVLAILFGLALEGYAAGPVSIEVAELVAEAMPRDNVGSIDAGQRCYSLGNDYNALNGFKTKLSAALQGAGVTISDNARWGIRIVTTTVSCGVNGDGSGQGAPLMLFHSIRKNGSVTVRAILEIVDRKSGRVAESAVLTAKGKATSGHTEVYLFGPGQKIKEVTLDAVYDKIVSSAAHHVRERLPLLDSGEHKT